MSLGLDLSVLGMDRGGHSSVIKMPPSPPPPFVSPHPCHQVHGSPEKNVGFSALTLGALNVNSALAAPQICALAWFGQVLSLHLLLGSVGSLR